MFICNSLFYLSLYISHNFQVLPYYSLFSFTTSFQQTRTNSLKKWFPQKRFFYKIPVFVLSQQHYLTHSVTRKLIIAGIGARAKSSYIIIGKQPNADLWVWRPAELAARDRLTRGHRRDRDRDGLAHRWAGLTHPSVADHSRSQPNRERPVANITVLPPGLLELWFFIIVTCREVWLDWCFEQCEVCLSNVVPLYRYYRANTNLDNRLFETSMCCDIPY